MDVLTIVASVACTFFSLGILHGTAKKRIQNQNKKTQFMEEKQYLSSVALLGEKRKA